MNTNNLLNTAKPVILAIALFFALSIAYMSPALSGKNVSQHDINMHKGQSKEIADHREETSEEALWTNSMFGGMPGYMISTKFNGNKLSLINKIVLLNYWSPVSFIFLYLLGFYFALVAFDVNRWIAMVGAIAYAFSSYLIIIIVAGHNSKVLALGYMPAIVGGVHLAFRGKYLWGALLTGIALGLQILVVHLQITYYTLLIILIYGLFELIDAIKKQGLKKFTTAVGVLLIAVSLAVGSNMSNLLTTVEYGKHSIRGKSELTSDAGNKTTGVDRDYATRWSYGRVETFTLMIPNFMGGASASELPQNSETFDFFSKYQGKASAKKAIKRMPTYWGDQPGTQGPVYIGAIICFLFVLGLFIIDKKYRWWLLSATILSIMLSWGKNLQGFTDFMFDYLPGYNKFRAVSMTLVIAGFTMPLMAILAFDKVIKKEVLKDDILKGLKVAYGVTAGFCLFFILFAKGLFDFESPVDQSYLAQGYTELVDALQADRAMLFRKDAFRSLVLISIAAGIVFFYVKEKLQAKYAIISLGVLILIDLWPVDKRYLNNDHFISKKKHEVPFTASKADQYILQDPGLSYRVVDLTTDPFNDASTSYFHKAIGGYHGAKMRRYQELIEHNISFEVQAIGAALQSQDINKITSTFNSTEVLNMLNTRYFIYNPEAQPLINQFANGSAWFVNNFQVVANADEEIAAIRGLNTKTTATIDKRFEGFVAGKSFISDSTAQIELTEYEPNRLVYEVKTQSEQLTVFSEIYYPEGWTVTIDGDEAEHFRVNYVLRAMTIPEGNHTIEFKFKPQSYFKGEKISLASSVIFLLLLLGAIGWQIKTTSTKEEK